MNDIKCERRIYTEQLNTHAHSFGQLILPLHGSLNIETNCKKLILDNKNLFFLPPNCEHTYKATENNEFLVLDIPCSMIIKYDTKKMQGGNKILFDDRWKAIRYLLLSEIDNKRSYYSITNLFDYCCQFIADENTSDSIKYINEHFNEDIDLQTLADIEHYNISYYSEWFKKNMSISPTEYIQNIRIDRAKELLLNTDFTILQIAQMVGYKHNSSLTRVFKNLEKITPAIYRRKIRK